MNKKILEKNLTVTEIEEMDFSSLVAIVREPNMCSGGKETIRTIIKEANLQTDLKILEVGSNTGYSSIQFALDLPHARVTGIDLNPISVEFSKEKAKKYGVKNVEFICANALQLPFEDNSFDVVFVSNVTSFISNREQAISEYLRVLKPHGFFVAAPISYFKLPPYEVVKAVEKAIAAPLIVSNEEQWTSLFDENDLSLYFSKKYRYIRSSKEEIEEYVDMVMSNEHLEAYDMDLQKSLRDRLYYFYDLFDKNLSFACFDILIYRYQDPNDIPILHKTQEWGGE